MTEEAGAAGDVSAPVRNRGRFGGCLLRIGIAAVVAVAVVVAIGTIFDQGEPEQRSSGFSAGPAEEYARADVNHFQPQRLLLVRYADGSFRAFSDKSSRQQELGGGCRIFYDEQAGLGSVEQLSGMRGAFVEDCEGTRAVWRADGRLVAGNSYGGLDEFETRVDDAGNLIVDTSERSCLRSKGVPGIPPYEKRTCSGVP
jgi:hypothetical protein